MSKQLNPHLTVETLLITYVNYSESSIGGLYACEVMADRPSFDTKYDMENLTIAVLPQQNPALGGLRSHYQLGDVLDAECTSAPSYPTAELTFYLNDIQVFYCNFFFQRSFTISP